MPKNLSITLKPQEGVNQAVTIFPDFRWSSPGGGWLTGGGKLEQQAAGVLLRDGAGRKRVWLLGLGLAAVPPASGQFHEDSDSPESSGLSGYWELKSVA